MKKMTKAQMIEVAQRREAALYLEYQDCRRLFGDDDLITRYALAAWSNMYTTLEAMNIPADIQLPDNQQAVKYREVADQRLVAAE
jgi:hypothetical protein